MAVSWSDRKVHRTPPDDMRLGLVHWHISGIRPLSPEAVGAVGQVSPGKHGHETVRRVAAPVEHPSYQGHGQSTSGGFSDDDRRPVARYLRVDRSHIIECRGEGMLRRKSVIDTHQFRTVGAGQRAVGAGRQRTTGDERPAGAASETRPKGTIGLQCPRRRVSNAILR